ncbi:hypothetical protein [Desertivirga arenae]|uniref:hypothetical protein n=1 Tax=Desertivirga arenae TaxID=2810309 RepID=UPI001A95A85F|nr:hypothetical protein [Pedobacter sp. SYSU D00823]
MKKFFLVFCLILALSIDSSSGFDDPGFGGVPPDECEELNCDERGPLDDHVVWLIAVSATFGIAVLRNRSQKA